MTNVVFFDTEGQGPDLPTVGTLNWVLDPRTRMLLLSYMLDEDPLMKLWIPDLSGELHPEIWAYICNRTHYQGELPKEIKEAAADPNCYWVAWNAGFDRAVIDQVGYLYGFPKMGIGRFLCAQAQAQASNLPGGLDMAGRALGIGEKTVGGKAVMKRFADPDLPLPGAKAEFEGKTVEERDQIMKIALEMWDLYLTYGGQDTKLMKDIWDVTRPLDAEEWREYWAHERINDKGMAVDVEFAAAAVKYKDAEEAWVIERCKELTDGAVQGPTFSAKITAWVYARLPQSLQSVMVKTTEEEIDEDTGKPTGNRVPKSLTLDKNTIKRLIEDIKSMDFQLDGMVEDNVVEFLELLEYGRSTSASKFQKIIDQSVPEEDPEQPPRLTYSYTFNGAGQTGRFCVDQDTLVDTDRGPRKIVDLRPGDLVVTHLGRTRPVTDLIYKGREEMFCMAGSNGAYINATAAHRVLTTVGWKRIDECFEKDAAGCLVLRGGCTPVSFFGLHHGADSGEARDDAPECERSAGAGAVTSGVLPAEVGELLSQQDGRSEPEVRDRSGSREDLAERPGSSVERDGLHVRASDHRGEVARDTGAASALGSASHRRGSDEQRAGQSGDRDEGRASEVAQGVAWTLVPLGVREVWDISVADDASYTAQGLVHHNSSRGVQIHNLPNKALLNELDMMDMIVAGVPIEDLRKLPLDKQMKEDWAKSNRTPTPTSVSAILGRLIRPTFIAPKGKMLVSCDWSAIEARVTPWLANTRDAREKVLEIFERTDGDKNQPDIYVSNAADIFGLPADDMWARYQAGDTQGKSWRQGGKIAVLSLGFLGGEGALKAMGRGYGMRFSGDEAKMIVDGWRARNKWARKFGDQAETAAMSAINNPATEFRAGRLTYVFDPKLMAGSLICILPDGRWLMYPQAKIVEIEKFGKPTKAITYLNGNGRASTWSGKLIENGTQAYAASLLRSTLVRIEEEWADAMMLGEVRTVGDTHDEIIIECDEDAAEDYSKALHEIMVRGFDHSVGLPLAAEAEVDWYYHK